MSSRADMNTLPHRSRLQRSDSMFDEVSGEAFGAGTGTGMGML